MLKFPAVTGRRLVAGLLLSRVVTLTSGCGPQAGELGGQCLHNQSCYGTDTCNNGLVCAGGTCEPYHPPAVQPKTPCEVLLAQTGSCPSGLVKSCIEGSATPDAARNDACVTGASDNQGDTIFCCDESDPVCLPGDGSLVPTTANRVSWGNCPGNGYLCHKLSARRFRTRRSSARSASRTTQAGHPAAACPATRASFSRATCGEARATVLTPRGTARPERRNTSAPETRRWATARATPWPHRSDSPTQARAYCCPSGYVPSAADAGSDVGVGDAPE